MLAKGNSRELSNLMPQGVGMVGAITAVWASVPHRLEEEAVFWKTRVCSRELQFLLVCQRLIVQCNPPSRWECKACGAKWDCREGYDSDSTQTMTSG